MENKIEDQTRFGEYLSKPTKASDQKINRILKFKDDGTLKFDESVENNNSESAWIINSKNVLGFRGDYNDNDNMGGILGESSRNKTSIGEATETNNFVYNGGVNNPDDPSAKNIPNYYDKNDKGYKDNDFETRVNATYMVEGMAVNQLRS